MKRSVKLMTVAAASAFALTIGTANAADLTVTSWGGAYTASQQKAYGEPWEAKTGKKIHWENYNGGLGEVRTQVEAGNVTWDIVDLLPDQIRTGCDEGLFVKVPSDKLTPGLDGMSFDEDMMRPRPNDCAVPQIFWSYMAFYDAPTFPNEKPTTMKDFFDVEKFPGKRGIHTWANALIEMALYADGVPIGELYDVMDTEEGIDRAFAKLDTIKDHAVFWSSGSKPLELVKSGEVAMALAYNGRVGAAILSEGESFVPVWDGQVLEEEWIAIVKGTKNLQTALDFANFASAPEQQAGQAKFINYGPMRKSGLKLIAAGEPWFHNGANIMEHMPNREEVAGISIFADPDWWADNGDEINERFEAWKIN